MIGGRLAKYNQLLRIEEELGDRCSYAGTGFRNIGTVAFVGGNWKCNGKVSQVKELLTECLAGDAVINVGIQNFSKTGEGAFTGEVSAGQVADVGIKYVLVGHSERRSLYGETDEAALDKGLTVVFCIGEQLSDRQSGKTTEVCETQMKAVIPVISDWSKIVIAYEPVWAIGTGVVATPLQAQETHYQDAVRIIYGGSANEKNCKALGDLPDVDGFLVGGRGIIAGRQIGPNTSMRCVRALDGITIVPVTSDAGVAQAHTRIVHGGGFAQVGSEISLLDAALFRVMTASGGQIQSETDAAQRAAGGIVMFVMLSPVPNALPWAVMLVMLSPIPVRRQL
ncbi:Triosephosphate isomerase, cytosolic [Symbiodinium microadriaticum]|uniref:Triosephosphate isomerase n=1 Tax=Symbiodinium microadriaticum TaxID=2951 RepID=A0A1Q9F511_SYMMI|nr:Triosephosphate isomerase, cytosolic [Symbiodinium microadriaticum]